jgi:hypothetical protein
VFMADSDPGLHDLIEKVEIYYRLKRWNLLVLVLVDAYQALCAAKCPRMMLCSL